MQRCILDQAARKLGHSFDSLEPREYSMTIELQQAQP